MMHRTILSACDTCKPPLVVPTVVRHVVVLKHAMDSAHEERPSDETGLVSVLCMTIVIVAFVVYAATIYPAPRILMWALLLVQ